MPSVISAIQNTVSIAQFDRGLAELAAERLARFDPADLIPEEEVWARLGLTQADLDSVGEAEFE